MLSPSKTTPDTIQADLAKYVQEVEVQMSITNALDFRLLHKHVYPRLSMIAEDLVSAPASEAFVERIFSVAGMLSSGHRNRMCKSLKMRVFLKLNRII